MELKTDTISVVLLRWGVAEGLKHHCHVWVGIVTGAL